MFLLKLTTPRLQMCLAHRRLIVVSLPFSHHIAPLFIPSHHLVSHLVRCSALTSHPIEINKPSYANRHVCISSNRLQSKVKHCIIKSCINMVKQQTNKQTKKKLHANICQLGQRRLDGCRFVRFNVFRHYVKSSATLVFTWSQVLGFWKAGVTGRSCKICAFTTTRS